MPFDTAFGNGVFIKPTGAGDYTQVDVYGHSATESDEGHEVTSTLHQGLQGLVASILRGQVTIRGHLKQAAYPWSLSIKAQGTGDIKVMFGAQQPFFMGYFISQVAYSNENAGGTDFEATFKLNAETHVASPSQSFVRPG